MSAIANIVAFDGAATPVSHTLIAESVGRDGKKMVATWAEALTTLPKYAQIKASSSMVRLPSGVWQLAWQTEVPVMESISGQNASGYTAAPKVAYTDMLRTFCYFHERGSIAGRRLARQLHANMLFGLLTTYTPTTVGPVPELFDQLIAPT